MQLPENINTHHCPPGEHPEIAKLIKMRCTRRFSPGVCIEEVAPVWTFVFFSQNCTERLGCPNHYRTNRFRSYRMCMKRCRALVDIYLQMVEFEEKNITHNQTFEHQESGKSDDEESEAGEDTLLRVGVRNLRAPMSGKATMRSLNGEDTLLRVGVRIVNTTNYNQTFEHQESGKSDDEESEAGEDTLLRVGVRMESGKADDEESEAGEDHALSGRRRNLTFSSAKIKSVFLNLENVTEEPDDEEYVEDAQAHAVVYKDINANEDIMTPDVDYVASEIRGDYVGGEIQDYVSGGIRAEYGIGESRSDYVSGESSSDYSSDEARSDTDVGRW
ncbi:unnamed protein product [Chrysodeixis includens]|uniref:Uncharacterized protein n=1 Tax=Chrysodeixis includens TaxID=689277 RepID=A0A9N8Q2C5_CHRIL|nr:unnamed protein product [Chrysodeixis includens]